MGLLQTSALTVNQNVEPSPYSLSKPILPFISSANLFDIVSPSPVPPYLRVVDEYA